MLKIVPKNCRGAAATETAMLSRIADNDDANPSNCGTVFSHDKHRNGAVIQFSKRINRRAIGSKYTYHHTSESQYLQSQSRVSHLEKISNIHWFLIIFPVEMATLGRNLETPILRETQSSSPVAKKNISIIFLFVLFLLIPISWIILPQQTYIVFKFVGKLTTRWCPPPVTFLGFWPRKKLVRYISTNPA